MEPSKNKPGQQKDDPVKGYNPTDRNFQNTDDAPVSGEENVQFDDDQEQDREQDETKEQTV